MVVIEDNTTNFQLESDYEESNSELEGTESENKDVLGLGQYLALCKNYYGVYSGRFEKYCSGVSDKFKTGMASRRRDKGHEPLGPVYLLRSVRDQIQLFQEKRGILSDENNFVNLMAVMIQQSGQAMYAVFTMFLALLPVASIFIHATHFILDRILDIISTRRKSDLWIKGSIFLIQLVVIFLILKFIMGAIFAPIFSMQITIISKMLFFEDDSVS